MTCIARNVLFSSCTKGHVCIRLTQHNSPLEERVVKASVLAPSSGFLLLSFRCAGALHLTETSSLFAVLFWYAPQNEK